MIPLIWFLFAWLMAIAVFLLLTLLTLGIFLRFGLSSFTTYASSAIFLLGIIGVLVFTGSYLLTVDWSQSINTGANFISPFQSNSLY